MSQSAHMYFINAAVERIDNTSDTFWDTKSSKLVPSLVMCLVCMPWHIYEHKYGQIKKKHCGLFKSYCNIITLLPSAALC